MKNLLFYIIIKFASFSVILGDTYKGNHDCGTGGNQVKILHQEDGEWKKIGFGDLIHPGAVLTYAQTVVNLSQKNLQVIDNQLTEVGLAHEVLKVIHHPDYQPCHGSGNFAILILKTSFPASNNPICLPTTEFMQNVNITKDCFIKSRTWSKYLISSSGGECQQLPYFPSNIRQFLRDFTECPLEKENSNVIVFSTTANSYCEFSEFGDENFRTYLLGQHYSRISCDKDDTGDYADFNENYNFYDICSWIKEVLQQTIENTSDESFI